MINDSQVKKILTRRSQRHPNDPQIQEDWDDLRAELNKDESETVQFLKRCSEEEISWVSEIFDDLSADFQSTKFIRCLQNLQKKFPDLNLSADIDFAEKAIARYA